MGEEIWWGSGFRPGTELHETCWVWDGENSWYTKPDDGYQERKPSSFTPESMDKCWPPRIPDPRGFKPVGKDSSLVDILLS